jgi:hypothetical protein
MATLNINLNLPDQNIAEITSRAISNAAAGDGGLNGNIAKIIDYLSCIQTGGNRPVTVTIMVSSTDPTLSPSGTGSFINITSVL